MERQKVESAEEKIIIKKDQNICVYRTTNKSKKEKKIRKKEKEKNNN